MGDEMRYSIIGSCQSEIHPNNWSNIVKILLPDNEQINKAVSGDSILKMWRRWKRDVLKQNPDTVIIFGGINDIVDAKLNPNKKMQKMAVNMITSAKENNIKVIFISLPPSKGAKWYSKKHQVWMDQFNNWLKLIPEIIFIDLYELFEDKLNPGAFLEEFDTKWHYKMNKEGHQKLGELIAEYLKE